MEEEIKRGNKKRAGIRALKSFRDRSVKILEEAVSYIGYAVSQAKTGRYSVETRQLLYAESLMRITTPQ